MFEMISGRFWFYVGAVLLFAAFTGAVYYQGGKGPRADLRTLQQAIQVAHDSQVKDDARREREHKQEIGEQDAKRDTAIAAVNAGWKSYLAGLPRAKSGTRADAQPVRIVAERCDNATGNTAVSSAVSEFRDETRTAVREFRDEVAGYLEAAQRQTDALVRMHEWVTRERIINTP